MKRPSRRERIDAQLVDLKLSGATPANRLPAAQDLGRLRPQLPSLEKDKAALLVVIGAMSDGTKEVLAVAPGYRESVESWAAVLSEDTVRRRDRSCPASTDTLPLYLSAWVLPGAGEGPEREKPWM